MKNSLTWNIADLATNFSTLISQSICQSSACSRMNALLMVLLVFSTSSLCTAKPTPQGSTCSSQNNFIMVHSDGTEGCWPCSECPLGQGLPYQCGSRLDWGTIIECKDCEAKRSYSDTHDKSTCKPCQECGGVTGMVKECTLEQNRICGIKCPKGWFMHPITDSCQKCFFCCKSATEDERQQKCIDDGMPTNMQCEETVQNQQCLKNNSTAPPTITPIPTNSSFKPNTSLAQEFSKVQDNNTQNNHSNGDPHLKENKSENSQSPMALILCATIIPGTFIVAGGIVGYIIWKKCKISSTSADTAWASANNSSEATNAEVGDDTNRQRTRPLAKTGNFRYRVVPDSDQGSANTSQESLDRLPLNESFKSHEMFQIPDGSSIPEDTRVSTILEMGELLDQLKSLDYEEKRSKKNWRSVGRALKVPKKTLDGIQKDYQSSSPTEGLLEYFETLGQKQPTVKMLFTALLTCERYDMAQSLCTCSWESTSTV